jgi:hypothetical protein
MINVIAIGGEPATGKSTILRRVIEALGPSEPFVNRDGRAKIVGTTHALAKAIVLGDYSTGQVFEGTDKFSMACQPDVYAFIAAISLSFPNWTIYFEGDRLFNGEMIKWLRAQKSINPKIILIEADEERLALRHIIRGDKQSATWLKGRRKKIFNILWHHQPVIRLVNENELTDIPSIVSQLVGFSGETAL